MTRKPLADHDTAPARAEPPATPAGAPLQPGHAADAQPAGAPPRGRDAFWDISRDLLAIASEARILLDVNPAWQRVLGLSVQQIVGVSLNSLIHPDDARASAMALASLGEHGPSVEFESRIRTQAAEDRHFRWFASAMQGAIYLCARDVTQERHRELALHDSRDFARLALSAVNGVGAWTYDVASDCFFCDEDVSRLYGIDAVEAANGIKRPRFLANIHPEDRIALAATMSGGLVESGDLELEYRICHPDGSIRHVLSKGHTYFTDDNTPWRRTGVAIDMTRQRELEQQLRQSQKMDAVGHLTGGIAHDFNNMLQGVTGPLELVRRLIARGRSEEIPRFIDLSIASAHRAAALTHRLLAFSRRQPLAAASVDVHQLIVSLNDLIRQSARESIAVSIAAGSHTCVVRCDPHQLESAVVNLAINASDAMPDGGRLTIEACIEELDEKAAVQHTGARAGRYVRLTVRDTGIGMPKKVMDQAFEPFFTTKPLGQGTGLGLSMVYGFVGQSGGFVVLESEVGAGTSVHLYLPENTKSGGIALRPVPRPETQNEGAGESVLIVDDDDTIRELLEEMLARTGYRTLSARDGPAALAILRSDARIDLLFTDVGLPGLNGRQLADAARVIRPPLPILFMTGYAEVATSGEFLDDGMRMLTKPFPMEAALSHVREMLDG